jgi:hypothetical protein
VTVEASQQGRSVTPSVSFRTRQMSDLPTKVYRMRVRSVGSDGSDQNEIRRLKMMLKSMLRQFRFRVLSIEQEPEQASEE